MSLVMWLLPDNPVLTKELRVRMRGARAYWVMFGYLAFLSLVLLFTYVPWWNNVVNSGGGGAQSSELGQQLFYSILITQIFLVLFITPAITSGSLTIEREQRTMDMLYLTRMARRSIVIGKLLAAVSFTSLLILTSLPLVSICFMLGSIDPALVLSAYLEMLLGSFFVGAMGLMWSSIARNTTLSVIFTYLTMVLMSFAGLLAGGFSTDHNGGSIGQNVGQSVGMPWFGNQFFGIQTIDGLGFVFFCILGGILMATVARVRLETFPERKGYLLRGLTLLIVGLELLAANLWWLNSWYHRGARGMMAQISPPTGAFILTTVVLLLIIPVFATGEIKSYEARHFGSYLSRGWTPKGLMRGKLNSALPFLLLTCLLCIGVYGLAFVLVGKAGDIGNSAAQMPTAAITMPTRFTPQVINGRPTQPPKIDPAVARATGPEYAAKIGGFAQIALLLVAMTFGYTLFCLLLSAVFRNRWVAWALAYLLIIMVWVVPVTSRGNGGDIKTGVMVNAYYLDPLQAIYQITEPLNFYEFHHFLNIKEVAMWRAVSLSWIGLGLLCFLLMLPLMRNERKKNGDVPFEETVADM